MMEAGVPNPDLIVPEWVGIFAPVGTPRDIVAQVQRRVAIAVNQSDVRSRLLASALEPVGSTQEDFVATYKANLEQFARIAKDLHIPKQD